MVLYPSEHLEAVGLRHMDVEDDDLGALVEDYRDGIAAIADSDHAPEAVAFEEAHHEPRRVRVEPLRVREGTTLPSEAPEGVYADEVHS